MKRSGPLRRQSKKTRAKERKATGSRQRWRKEAGCCMVCGYSPHRPNPYLPTFMSKLVCHEISNGPLRLKTIGEPSCVLVACRYCNEHWLTNKADFPEARQLAILQAKAPARYDLRRFIQLTSPQAPDRITQADVDSFRASD